MVSLIVDELNYFYTCILSGFLLAMCYDIFRIFRKIIRHTKHIIIIQDLMYGIGVGVYIFCLNYINNNGSIRIFVFIAILLGIFLYSKFFSNSVVHIISYFLKKIRKKIGGLLRIVEKITINMNIRWKKLSKFRKL